MGTRSKSKAAAGLLSALLLLALAVGLLAGLRPLYARAQEQGVLFYYYDPFVENIQTANHTLYWRAREQGEGKEFEPSELLLSDANAAVYAARDAGEDFVPGYTGAAGDESGGTNASYGGLDVYAPDAISALDAFNASVKAHADELAGSWGNLFYAVTDDATGKTYTNTEAGLGGFLSDDPAKNGFDAAQWRYVLALRFDAQGNMSYAASYLGEEGQQDFSASIWNTDMQAYGTDAIRRHLDLDVLSYYDLSAPKSVTFVYGVPRVFAASDDISWYIATSQERSFISHAFDPLFAAALALAALLALWFGRRRGSGLGGGHDEREQTLNQLLVEMDGFAANEGVVVLAATNRVDILDPALLRPGRFDRQVFVGLPDIKGREEILKIHAKGKPLAEDVDLVRVARATAGFTGADLENLLNEAALLTGRQDKKLITEEAIHQSVIKVIAGPEKHSRVVPEAERRLTAFHEAGHAVVMHALPRLDPVHQITIVPRGQAGGMTIYLPEEDRSYLSRSYMLDQVAGLLGGRVAEEMMLGDISTGASSDIQRATAIARKMVGTYGMSAKMGSVAFDAGADEVFIGKSMGHTRPYSEETAAEMDAEIRAIIDAAYQQCREILARYKSQLTAVAEYLLENETMDAETFETYFADSGENGESRV